MAQRSESHKPLPDTFQELLAGEEEMYDILENRYDQDVVDAARAELHDRVPGGPPEDRARWVESRLYRLLPDRFYTDPFDSDHLNAIYSSVRPAQDEDRGAIGENLALRRIDLDRHDAVVLDHSVVFQIFDRQVHSYYDDGRKEIPYTEAMEFLDEVLRSTEALLYVPSDLGDKIDGYPKYWDNEEPRRLLENAALKFDIATELGVSDAQVSDEKREDFGIGCAAEGLGVRPVVATYDSDFLAIQNQYDIDVGVPMTGDESGDVPV